MPDSWPDKDDNELLTLVKDGSHRAFGVLVERHIERFYRLAYRYLQDRATAEDIVQDAFLKLWEGPGLWQAEREAKFTTWFYRIVINLCLDWRKKKRPLELDPAMPLVDDRGTADEIMIRNEEEKMLEQEIASLPDRQRTALNLCFGEGLSNQEAAAIMGIKLKALQSLIMRAKTTLRQKMKTYL